VGYLGWGRKRADPAQKKYCKKIAFKMKPNLHCFKSGLSELKKIEIKYNCESFEIRNKFPYRNFSRFEINFELKIQRNFYELNSIEICLKY
jgi:hypothetical protein